MKLAIAAALAAWFAAAGPAALAQIEDIERLTFTAVARMPDGPGPRVRATPPLRIETGAMVAGGTMYTFGTLGIEELDLDRYRATHIATRLKVHGRGASIDVALPNIVAGRAELDELGRPLKIERTWQDLPVAPPSAQVPAQTWNTLRATLQDHAKNWLKLLDDYEDASDYRADFVLGAPMGPTTLAELVDVKMTYLEAMVRGNTVGFWGDLPQGTLTPARKNLLVGVVRDRGTPKAFEGDVRVRGSTSYAGRTFILVSGTFTRTPKSGPAVDGAVDMLIDPATGVAGLYRRRTTLRGSKQTELRYAKIGL